MKTQTLSFGLLGRCGCGALGKRRAQLADEPICGACLPGRRGYLEVRTVGAAERMHELTVGRLTPAQRRARVAWLTNSFTREAVLLIEQEDILAHAVPCNE
jgi:hypothetical protein